MTRRGSFVRRLVLELVVPLLGTVVLLADLQRPWPWVLLLWAGAAIHALVWSPRTRSRLIALHLAVALLTLTAAEVWVERSGPRPPDTRFAQDYHHGYVVDHEILGYAARPGATATAIKLHHERPIYRVTYTIGDNGLRVEPPRPPADDDQPCVLFFGGSYTFGEGVEDWLTAAWRVTERSSGRIRAHNFGFHGYGPHQMLATLEHRLEAPVLGCRPVLVVYQAVLDHVVRVAGRATWDRRGPRYVVAADGQARLNGTFADIPTAPTPTATVLTRAERSALVRRILTNRRNHRDGRLLAAVVAASRDIVAERYPGARFVVLLWDDPGRGRAVRALTRLLSARGVEVEKIGSILPGWDDDPTGYRIDRHDIHPNPLAHDLIAGRTLELVGAAGLGISAETPLVGATMDLGAVEHHPARR